MPCQTRLKTWWLLALVTKRWLGASRRAATGSQPQPPSPGCRSGDAQPVGHRTPLLRAVEQEQREKTHPSMEPWLGNDCWWGGVPAAGVGAVGSAGLPASPSRVFSPRRSERRISLQGGVPHPGPLGQVLDAPWRRPQPRQVPRARQERHRPLHRGDGGGRGALCRLQHKKDLRHLRQGGRRAPGRRAACQPQRQTNGGPGRRQPQGERRRARGGQRLRGRQPRHLAAPPEEPFVRQAGGSVRRRALRRQPGALWEHWSFAADGGRAPRGGQRGWRAGGQPAPAGTPGKGLARRPETKRHRPLSGTRREEQEQEEEEEEGPHDSQRRLFLSLTNGSQIAVFKSFP